MNEKKKAISKTRQQLADMFLNSIKSDQKLPWNQPWISQVPGLYENYNGTNGKKYRGLNAVILWMTAFFNKYSDPRWCTYNQAQQKGWQVRRGEKGVPVEFWSVYDKLEKKMISFREAETIREADPGRDIDLVITVKSYTVFNLQQMDGVPAIDHKIEPFEFTDDLEREFSACYLRSEQIRLYEGDSAYYTPSTDTITMPPKERFVSEMAYYDTLFHEIAHSTGAPKRLNRNLLSERKEEYAIEELRAEIASAFIASATGTEIPMDVSDNNKAYVQSWAEKVENDPQILMASIKDAEKIADFVVERGQLERIRQELAIKAGHTKEAEEISVKIYDLVMEYAPENLVRYDRDEQISLTADCIRTGDTEEIQRLLTEIKTYGGTDEMVREAGVLMDQIDTSFPRMEKREEEIAL